MSVSVRRNIIIAVLGAFLSFSAVTLCAAQEPEDNPPLQDEKELPNSEVPAIFSTPPAPFEKAGEKKVLDNILPAQDQTEVIDGAVLHPGQKLEVNQQLPGFESEGARLINDNSLPSLQDTSALFLPNAEMTRKEAKMQRKAEKNKPLELPEFSRDAYRISSGQRSETYKNSNVLISADSLITILKQTDGSINNAAKQILNDSTLVNVTPRQRRGLERLQMRNDTMFYRHSPLFKDTIKVSSLTAISLVVPGFGQLYNGDYWKIPVLYATTSAAIYFGVKQHQQYARYRNEYDYLMSRPAFNKNRELIDPVQTKMIQHNTWQQLLFGAAIGSYIYFVGDAIVNYPTVQQNHIQAATLLSAICPGAGQIYNKSYWKMPLLLGGFATFAYVIDWNNRGYVRYSNAINLELDNDPETTSGLNMTVEQMKNYKKLYRRNRDLSIILTAAFYLLNVMDAHVDASMKDFDVSDELAWRLQPAMDSMYTTTLGQTYAVGLNLSYKF